MSSKISMICSLDWEGGLGGGPPPVFLYSFLLLLNSFLAVEWRNLEKRLEEVNAMLYDLKDANNKTVETYACAHTNIQKQTTCTHTDNLSYTQPTAK